MICSSKDSTMDGGISGPQRRLRRTISLDGKIDRQDVFRLLHERVRHINITRNAYFVNDDALRELYERVLRLKFLSVMCVLETQHIGDFWRFVYRGSAFKSLKRLTLFGIDPSSQASRLFAKCSSWCKVQALYLSLVQSTTRLFCH